MIKNRKLPIYGLKSFDTKVDDVDTRSRKVRVVLSSFDTIDSDGDIIRAGSFANSIAQRGVNSTSNRKIAFLRMHDWNKQIGKFTELYEDSLEVNGLVGVGELGRSTLGEDALLDYQDGILREHSIGFAYIKERMRFVELENIDKAPNDLIRDLGGYWEIKELNLFEGSAVTFGAQENTPVLSVAKSANNDELQKALYELNTEMKNIQYVLKNGKGSDDRFYRLEMRMKQAQHKYNSIIDVLITNKKDIKQDVKEQQQSKKSDVVKFFENL